MLICDNLCLSVAVLSACIRVIRGLDFRGLALCLLVAWSMSGCARPAHSRPPAAALVSVAGVDAAEPAVATSSDGSIYVAWVEHFDGQANVMVEHFDISGAYTTPATRVNPNSGEATAWRGDPPSLAVSSDGTLYVAWTARVPEKSHATNLYISVSRDKGETFEKPVKINDHETPGAHGMHSLVIGSDGTVYVSWLEDPKKPSHEKSNLRSHKISDQKSQEPKQGHKHMEENRNVFVAFSTNGGKTFSSKTQVAGDACPCCKTSLAVAPNGRVYASWRQVLPGNFRHIAVAAIANRGQPASTRVIVSDDKWMLAGCPVSGSSLSVSSDGTLQVLWYADGQAGPKGVYRAESRNGGQSFSPRQLIAEGMVQGTPIILRQSDRTFAVWQRGQGIEANVLTASIDSKGVVPSSITEELNSQLPAAAIIGDRVVLAAVHQTADDRRSIWFVVRPAFLESLTH